MLVQHSLWPVERDWDLFYSPFDISMQENRQYNELKDKTTLP